MGDPRILAIIGSGETAPAMAKVHRSLFDRLGPGSVPAAILDTPYGFQENADDLSARTVRFFEESLDRPAVVASYRSRGVDGLTAATAVARIRAARYVMAGPGSPSYALRQWAAGPIAAALADRLRDGGVLVMASAAALTLGVVTIPVYEIYKVGEDPRWLPGLDLLGPATGLSAAVVPHWDNAEGGNHDTRFCYMGEHRLQLLERALPEGAFILDLADGGVRVAGLGGVTVRVDGRATFFPSGSQLSIEVIGAVARDLAAGTAVDIGWEPSGSPAESARGRRSTQGTVAAPVPPLRDEMTTLEGAFVAALGQGDSRSAVRALLDLDSAIEARTRAGEDSPDLDNARSTFRALITRLGDASGGPPSDRRQSVAPFADALIELREHARADRDWELADLIRTRLEAAGVDVHDTPAGSSWSLT